MVLIFSQGKTTLSNSPFIPIFILPPPPPPHSIPPYHHITRDADFHFIIFSLIFTSLFLCPKHAYAHTIKQVNSTILIKQKLHVHIHAVFFFPLKKYLAYPYLNFVFFKSFKRYPSLILRNFCCFESNLWG
jgi:hypothetical protein